MQPVLLALLAAVGNSVLAFGLIRSGGLRAPFVFLMMVSASTFACASVCAALSHTPQAVEATRGMWRWSALSGFGLFMVLSGFLLLYSRYGATHYMLYAVLSVMTTTVVVGVIIMGERLGALRVASLFTCILTIILFASGRSNTPSFGQSSSTQGKISQ